MFNTPFDRYKFLRMPFGLSCSPEVWQRNVSQLYENVEGCAVIADNILVWARDTAEHNKRLQAVLQKAQDSNLKLNRSKLRIGLHEVTLCWSHLHKARLKSE